MSEIGKKAIGGWSSGWRSTPIIALLFNHLDAWIVAFCNATLALFLHGSLSLRTWVLVAALTVGYWFAFALNDYYDAVKDAQDPHKRRRNFFAQAVVPRSLLLVAAATIILLIVAGFLLFGWLGLLMTVIGCFIMWAYSSPPLYLKGKAGLDLIIHGLFVQTFPYVVPLILIRAHWQPYDWMLVLLSFMASFAGQLEQQIRDFKVDAATATGTFTTTVGIKTAATLMRAVTLCLYLLGIWGLVVGIIPLYLAPIALIALPAMFHRFVRPAAASRSERLVHLSVVVGLLYVVGLIAYFGLATRVIATQ